MRFLKTKKGAALLVTLVVAAAVAVGAYAYFSTSGTGTGTVGVGQPATSIGLTSPTVGTLYPGGAAVPVTVTMHNTGGGSQLVGTISGTVEDNGGCLGSWFSVAPVTYGQEVPAGSTATASTTVSMLDPATNQNVCGGLSMTIDWSSN